MDTHKLLKEWYGHRDYPKIARLASQLAKENIGIKDILEIIDNKYEPQSEGFVSKAAPLNIFGLDLIQENTINQMYDALKIPPAIGGALMPDAHYGYSLPIGGIISLDGSVSPRFIGYDISCMMMVTVLDINQEDFLRNKESFFNILVESTSFGLGSTIENPEHSIMSVDVWNDFKSTKQVKALAQTQLGSSGGGNHFANIMLGTYKKTGTKFVALMTHSGSRGAGHKLATYYSKIAEQFVNSRYKNVKKGYEWLELDTDEGQEYLNIMWLMGRYALANHKVIHNSFLKEAVLEIKEIYWNRHNYAWVGLKNVLHRKGATPAGIGQVGIIPGSSGTNSYLVKGKGNAESLSSSSHGAGRIHSRTDAKKVFNPIEFANKMTELDVMYGGIDADEGFKAYKDIDSVIKEQEDLIEVFAIMKPSIVLMGGKSDDGD